MNKTVGALVVLSAAAGIAIGVLTSQTVSAQPKPMTRMELLNVDLEGLQRKRAHLYTVELAPGVLTPESLAPGALLSIRPGRLGIDGRRGGKLPSPYYREVRTTSTLRQTSLPNGMRAETPARTNRRKCSWCW